MYIWTIEDGLKLVRALQGSALQYGYHICLGGSVLNFGYSKKDVDLYFLPYNKVGVVEDREGLLKWLQGMWGPGKEIQHSPEDTQVGSPNKWIMGKDSSGAQMMIINPEYNPYYNKDVPPPWTGEQVYKMKYKFVREGGDRVDVFIL